MIAVDTNVVIRLLTGDDPDQAERARALFASEAIFVPKTVMLESEWALRRLYKIGRSETLAALSGLMALPNVRCEAEPALTAALAWAARASTSPTRCIWPPPRTRSALRRSTRISCGGRGGGRGEGGWGLRVGEE